MLVTEPDAVFYNNIQGINRDMSIQVINLFSEVLETERKERAMARHTGEPPQTELESMPEAPQRTGISVLEALAATGLRSVRYMQEIPKIRTIVLNDLSAEATKTARRTLAYNNINMERVVIHNKDANDLMHEYKSKNDHFDVIDLDPYGSSAPFLDAAVQAVAGDGGLLCLTCTDYATLCGVHPATSLGRYGTLNFPTGCKAEVALRTLLHAVDSAANRHQRYIVPWLSISIDYYVRVFVRVYKSKLEVKNSLLKRLMLYQAEDCPSFYTHSLGRVRSNPKKVPKPLVNVLTLPAMCEQTGGNWKMGGPFWGGPLHSQIVVDELLERVKEASKYSSIPKQSSATDTVSPTADLPNIETDAVANHVNSFNSTLELFPSTTKAIHHIPTAKRLTGILTSMSLELKDVPFFYSLPDLASAVQCETPRYAQMEAAITNAGYLVSNFHHDPTAVKTNAPDTLIWDIMRAYCHLSERNAPPKKLSPTAQKIRAVPSVFRPDFTIKEKSTTVLSGRKVARYLKNEPNWGPRPRARPAGTLNDAEED
eukprot:gene18788-21381_t